MRLLRGKIPFHVHSRKIKRGVNNSCSRRSSLSSSYVSFHLKLLLFSLSVHWITINSQHKTLLDGLGGAERRERIAYDCLNIIFLSTCYSCRLHHRATWWKSARRNFEWVSVVRKIQNSTGVKFTRIMQTGWKFLWTCSCRAHFHSIFSGKTTKTLKN